MVSWKTSIQPARARSDSPEQEEEYTVERILDVQTTRRGLEYYVKWQGYSDNESTWEPERNLDGPEAQDLIQAFWAARQGGAGGGAGQNQGQSQTQTQN